MTNFLFWNIGRRHLTKNVVSLAHKYDVDVLILAESKLSENSLEAALNENQEALYFPDSGYSDKLQIYTRFMNSFFKPLIDYGGIAIRHLIPPLGKDIIISSVHLPSKLYHKESDQIFFCIQLIEAIKETEKKIGHTRTIILGDLNMNPFEVGIISAKGLHAISDHRIAKKGYRKVQGKQQRYFYNPMWNFFGDMSTTPPGTYFFDSGNYVNYYWHMFDQVLIRPNLLDLFQIDSLKIITEINGISLLSGSGRPNKNKSSDHLPIFFSLNL